MTRDAGTHLAPPNSAETADSQTRIALLEFAPDVLLVVDSEGLIKYANSRVRDVFHYEPNEIVGRSVEMLIPERLRRKHTADRARFAVQPRVRQMGEGRTLMARRRNGEEFTVDVALAPIASEGRPWASVALRDVTEKNALQRQVSGLQKVEAVGRLAGAVAHDFNNILTAITAFADAAYQSARSGSAVRSNLEEVLAATERARILTTKLLDFAKRRPIEPIVVDINVVVRATQRMIDVLLHRNVQVVHALSPNVGLVRVDPGGIEQVIVNLCVNACDAMPNGGQLTIATSHVVLSPEEVASFGPNTTPGPYVVLRVADTGIGMTDDVRQHVFEPFFSTKSPGIGSGLGLATCYGLVVQAGGFIGLNTQLGKGTQVDVYFPQVAVSPAYVGSLERPRGTVLIVEADQTVRNVAARELAHAGFTPIVAAGWLDALDAVRDQSSQVNVLIVDLGIPATDGFELAHRIRRLCPTVNVLFMSQHDAATLVAKGAKIREEELLQKPFGTVELLAKVDQISKADRSHS